MISQNKMEAVREPVTAVVVACQADQDYLPRTLQGLYAQDLKPQRIFIAVPEQTAELTELVRSIFPATSAALTSETVSHNYPVRMPAVEIVETGVVNSLAAALQKIPALAEENTGQRGWIWILHADSAPDKSALNILLRKGELSQAIGAVGPKQLTWIENNPAAKTDKTTTPKLLEVGIRATRSARRVPEVDLGERDQGQHDNREDMLAIGTAGMLVRSDIYRQLGGLNSDLGPFGDGLEFSRRIRLAGYRVVVAPAAVVYHRQFSFYPDSPAGVEASASNDAMAQSYGRRRQAQIFNSLLAAPDVLLVFCWLGYILGGIARMLIRLAGRDLVRARGEIAAAAHIATSFSAVRRGRKKIAAAGSAVAGLRALEARPVEIRWAKREAKKERVEARQLSAQPNPLIVAAQQDLRRHTRRGFIFTLLVAIFISILFNLPYFSSGTLAGGQLLGDSSTAGELWQAIRNSWLLSGDGYSLPVDSLWLILLPLLALGAPFHLSLGTLLTFLLYAAIPLGAGGAYLFAGRFTKSWLVRTGAAIFWVLSPALLEALSSGRIGPVLVHIFIPLLGWALIGAWRGYSGHLGLAALIFALIAASAPIFLIFSFFIMLIALLGAKAKLIWLWLPVPAFVLLLPSLISLKVENIFAFLFSSPGLPYAGAKSPLQVAQGFTTRPFDIRGADAFLFGGLALLIFLAVLLLLRGQKARQIRFAWLLAICGFFWALISPYLLVAWRVEGGRASGISAWHGLGLSCAWLGLFLVFCFGSYGLFTALRQRNFGFAHALTGIGLLLFPLALLGIMGQWAHIQISGVNAVLHAQPAQVVPALAEKQMNSPARARVLALRAYQSGYNAEIWRAAGLQLHEFPLSRVAGTASLANSDPAQQDLEKAVADLLTGSAAAVPALHAHGISIVLLPPAAAGEAGESRSELASYLFAAPGLEYVTENETGQFWRITGPDLPEPAPRAAIAADGAALEAVAAGKYRIKTEIAAGNERNLVLAERKAAGWHAELNGRELEKDSPSWEQRWKIPAEQAGTLYVTYRDSLRTGILIAQMVVGIIAVVAALPLGARRRKERL